MSSCDTGSTKCSLNSMGFKVSKYSPIRASKKIKLFGEELYINFIGIDTSNFSICIDNAPVIDVNEVIISKPKGITSVIIAISDKIKLELQKKANDLLLTRYPNYREFNNSIYKGIFIDENGYKLYLTYEVDIENFSGNIEDKMCIDYVIGKVKNNKKLIYKDNYNLSYPEILEMIKSKLSNIANSKLTEIEEDLINKLKFGYSRDSIYNILLTINLENSLSSIKQKFISGCNYYILNVNNSEYRIKDLTYKFIENEGFKLITDSLIKNGFSIDFCRNFIAKKIIEVMGTEYTIVVDFHDYSPVVMDIKLLLKSKLFKKICGITNVTKLESEINKLILNLVLDNLNPLGFNVSGYGEIIFMKKECLPYMYTLNIHDNNLFIEARIEKLQSVLISEYNFSIEKFKVADFEKVMSITENTMSKLRGLLNNEDRK